MGKDPPKVAASTPTLAAVGRSLDHDGFKAGRLAAEASLGALGCRQPSLVLVFGTSGHDQQQLIAGVVEVTGRAPLAGCSAEGVITQEGSDEGSHAVAVMSLASESLWCETLSVGEVSRDAVVAARALAMRAQAHPDAKAMLLFPDGLTVDCGAVLHELDALINLPILRVGGAAGCIMGRAPHMKSYQYHDGRVLSDGIAAVLLGGDISLEVAVAHGCEPIGKTRRVTRVDGSYVAEIDGRPALEVFNEFVECGPDDLLSGDVLHVSLGLQIPAADTAIGPRTFVVRSPLRSGATPGSLFFAGGDLGTGTRIRMMRRDAQRVLASAVDAANAIVARRPHDRPIFVLQFDCAGRGHVLFGEKTTDSLIEPPQRIIGKNVPWIGFHSFGEIAPQGGVSYYHNFTVALCAIYDGVSSRNTAV